jgi:hypothetical protein
MENKKTNWVLWVGLAIPVIVLLFVAILSYAPNNFTAKYDFLYYFRDYNYNYCMNGEAFVVKDQKISINRALNVADDGYCKMGVEKDPPRIYRYNILTSEITPLTLSEAQKLSLDNNPISPDGVSIQRGNYYNSGILEIFGGSNNSNSLFLKKGDGQMKKVQMNNGDYMYNFVFIGWVIK